MVFRNLEALDVTSVRKAVKVGDTVSDILEGRNAGVWTVGVLEGSSELCLSMEEFDKLDDGDRDCRILKARKKFYDSGADFVIRTMGELPELIAKIEDKTIPCSKR